MDEKSLGIIELVKNRETREPLVPYNSSSPVMTALRQSLLEQGRFVYTHWHMLLLAPPLMITADRLAEGFTALDKALMIAVRVV